MLWTSKALCADGSSDSQNQVSLVKSTAYFDTSEVW